MDLSVKVEGDINRQAACVFVEVAITAIKSGLQQFLF
jgi:hypothetical protein